MDDKTCKTWSNLAEWLKFLKFSKIEIAKLLFPRKWSASKVPTSASFTIFGCYPFAFLTFLISEHSLFVLKLNQ